MTAAASYLVEISPTNADRTNVGGTANLGGTVQAAFASGSYATRAYTILSAAGGLNGTTFNTLTTTNLPAGFTPSLSYTATDVILNLTAALGALTPLGVPNAPSTCAFSINQCNVANAINAFFNNGGTLPPAFANPSTPAALRSPSTRATRPIPTASWAGASTGCCCSTPRPRSRYARAWRGRTIG